MLTHPALLSLLQLASPALPVGAYSYSEGLETLVDRGIITNPQTLNHWINRELQFGAIRMDAAVMVRCQNAATLKNTESLQYWNDWISAARETEELREQSWQMGNSLIRLLLTLTSEEQKQVISRLKTQNCNFAVAFGVGAACWQIAPESALLGYLHSWASNLISAGIKLIPLGQTVGQQLLLNLQPSLIAAIPDILTLKDDDLSSCAWGLALASMQHETQYSRLFRS